MAGVNRKPLQGVSNIVWFNWHYYAAGLVFLGAGVAVRPFLTGAANAGVLGLVLAAGVSMTVSLAVSLYVYDLSGLYALGWLRGLPEAPGTNLVNIHAGFDETSALLRQRYPKATWQVFDFYDPARHTEISIRRARKAYAAFPGTRAVATGRLPLPAGSVDAVLLIMAAHEIRDPAERIAFFAQLRAALRPGGKVVVVEHLRDGYNLAAYHFGFFHFYSRRTWRHAFDAAGLQLVEETKITPFVSVFTLQKNDTAP
ncbi:MAG: hypothetical protein AVDCRST_MAG56-3001 [uncultured Cytophagales bacterium]|uniref:Methyltransferase type 11 domain-containing protein n=1 Tax=uncultured Cytophagales bacterium TaxID=158755 RepID=A0A6J4J4L9_9SPHI|nr:MAG: hypothetical protein AVDCRST_MAG56-3001 [uncultured Cytophagales bacterium]